ncbi:MAG: hypothetical protein U9R75_04000 [Candidatus Thermoplasmatota archaeon]|nr:hypothetical protein [Candidatus Thermoplasmatota archaeon]
MKNKGAFVKVFFSLTSLNDEIHRTFEAYTCTPEDRLDAMGKLSEAGISTDALLMPVLPFISDTEEELDPLFSAVKEKGGGHIIPEPLRLTANGPQREMFMDVLKGYSPSLVKEYEKLYPPRSKGWKFGAGPGITPRTGEVARRLEELSKKYDLPPMFERPVVSRGRPKQAPQRTLGDFF